MIWTAAYVSSVVAVNWAFTVLPMISTPWGPISPGTVLVGGIFILRDFSQREIGHRVLGATLLGIGISYVMADPFVALASAAAFGASEIVDWAIYTVTRRPFKQRVVASSLVSVPVDTAVFLGMLGWLSFPGFVLMCATKWIALGALALPAPACEPCAAPVPESGDAPDTLREEPTDATKETNR